MRAENKTTFNICMDEETSAKTAAPSWKPLNLKELDKTALEYSTVKRGDSQGKGRPRCERLFRGGVDGSNGRQEVWVFSREAG